MKFILLLLFSLNVEAANCVHSPTSFKCVEFVMNHDGDTLTVNIKKVHALFGKKITVRVAGIDTPELNSKDVCEKAAAIKARDFVAGKLVTAKRIDLVNVKRDKYFRILADIVVDGKPLKELIEQSGLSLPYDGGTKVKKDWCK